MYLIAGARELQPPGTSPGRRRRSRASFTWSAGRGRARVCNQSGSRSTGRRHRLVRAKSAMSAVINVGRRELAREWEAAELGDKRSPARRHVSERHLQNQLECALELDLLLDRIAILERPERRSTNAANR